MSGGGHRPGRSTMAAGMAGGALYGTTKSPFRRATFTNEVNEEACNGTNAFNGVNGQGKGAGKGKEKGGVGEQAGGGTEMELTTIRKEKSGWGGVGGRGRSKARDTAPPGEDRSSGDGGGALAAPPLLPSPRRRGVSFAQDTMMKGESGDGRIDGGGGKGREDNEDKGGGVEGEERGEGLPRCVSLVQMLMEDVPPSDSIPKVRITPLLCSVVLCGCGCMCDSIYKVRGR